MKAANVNNNFALYYEINVAKLKEINQLRVIRNLRENLVNL
jgi:hypothetical protein